MGKKENPLPPLRMSLDQADKRLKTQIAKGQAIRERHLRSKNTYNWTLVAQRKWLDQSGKLLTRMFVDDSIAKEHLRFEIQRSKAYLQPKMVSKKPSADQRAALRKSTYDRIVHLDLVMRRLGLKSLIIRKRRRPVKSSKQISKTPANFIQVRHSSSIYYNTFIVHGHDELAKESVARFVEKIGLTAIILHEQPNAGRTIIEKFEDHSNVGFAIALLTPDDIGAPQNKRDEAKPRARQNVILELGYFMGKLGRGKVCALYKEGVEIPSDYQGVLYIPMDSTGAWKMALAKEIKNAGIEVDLNKVL